MNLDRFPEPPYVNDPSFEDTFSSVQLAVMNNLNECRVMLKAARNCLVRNEAKHLDDAWNDILSDTFCEAFPNNHDTAYDWFETNHGGIK